MSDLLRTNQQLAVSRFGPLVCGIDEAGRGPLAGPVCCAAVILKPDYDIPGLNDSKKITEKRREAMFDNVLANCTAYAAILIDNKEIDATNILAATLKGMSLAVQRLSPAPVFAAVDGNILPQLSIPAQAVVGGDGMVACIAAASVVAKVTRDRLMREYALEYPQYGFEKHKGYGTKQHYAAIASYGITPIHRLSFLKGVYNE